MPYSTERRRRTPAQQAAAWVIVGVGVLMLVALWLVFGQLEQVGHTLVENRQIGYGNRAAACQNLVAAGVDVKAVPACQDPRVTALYDQTAARTIGSVGDQQRTQRMLCTLAAGARIQVPECGG